MELEKCDTLLEKRYLQLNCFNGVFICLQRWNVRDNEFLDTYEINNKGLWWPFIFILKKQIDSKKLVRSIQDSTLFFTYSTYFTIRVFN